MQSLRTQIENAIDKLVVHRRPSDFQRLAFHVASFKWPALCATTLVSDLGADALIPFRDGETKFVLACGIDGDLTKLKEDCRRLRDTHPETRDIVFATTRPVTEVKEGEWRKEIRREFGVALCEIIQREFLTSELEKPSNRWLCRDYLEIPVTEFEHLPEILPRIRLAAGKLLVAWKDKHQFQSHPLIDLPLEERENRGSDTVYLLSALPHRLRAGDRCWITGAPGAGKTFSLITIASDLSEPNSLIPIPVSLRDLSQRRRELVEWIASRPSFQEQKITEAELANAASGGKLLILLNGWNEIARDAWMPTTETIMSFVREMPAAAVLVASRQPPEREFPAREFRLKPISGEDIRKAIGQSGLQDPERHADFILASSPLSKIATVPLFLQAIVEEVKAGNDVPLGKQAMLRRIVERAVKEHRSALEHGEVRENALRYLRDLAWNMTCLGSTTLPDKEARLVISKTVGELKKEALLGEAPAPPDILEQLRAGHLLVGGFNDEVAFTHQLIQEHFAATAITSAIVECASNRDSVFSRETLAAYQWEQPLFLALEDLAVENRHTEVRVLLEWFRLVDFEGACRMAGTVSDSWPRLRDLFVPVIRHLASVENVNARWLAARCAAAIGQPEFEDLVWAALDGHPKGSSDCFEGISSTFFLRALGGGFVQKLLQIADEELRFRALALAGRSPSAESLALAESLVIQDRAPGIRRVCFGQLFISGRRGWLRHFLRDIKAQGWSLGMLRVLRACPRCTIERFRKFIGRYFENQTTPEERIKTLTFCSEIDAASASMMARAEYERLAELPSVATQNLDMRLFCLRKGARNDHQWAIARVLNEAFSPEGSSRLGAMPLNILPDKERALLVQRLLPKLAKREPNTVGAVRRILELAPVVAAECLLRAIVTGVRQSAPSDEQHSLRQALHEVSHTAVVEAVLHADFEQPDPEELSSLLHAVSIGWPGGNPDAVQLLPEKTLTVYRKRLLYWSSLLPRLDRKSAFDWAVLATLIGEVKHPDDAELLHRLLREDETRLLQLIESRRLQLEAYESSGRTTIPPSPIDQTSYGNWHIAALANLPGKRCMEIMIELLANPYHIGTAAHALAKDAGAEPIDLLFEGVQSRPRYDLIYERRLRRKSLGELALHYDAAIKNAIDQHLTRRYTYLPTELLEAFCAVARFAVADFEGWILDRLELHFSKTGAESILEYITLAGGLLPGVRIWPFVRNTITCVVRETRGQHDQTYLLTKALVSLFFTDTPDLAIELLESETAWFLKSYQFRWLLGILAWERSALVGTWLEQLLDRDVERTETLDAIFECLLERSRRENDRAAIVAIANRIARAGASVMQSYSARRTIVEMESRDEILRYQLLALAGAAQNIDEAAGWLIFISEIGTAEGIRVAFELAERFGEQLGVLNSLAPAMQEGTSLRFQGWFYFGGGTRRTGALYRLPDIIAKLHEFTGSPEPAMRVAADRALLWIERERILTGSRPFGKRTIAPHLNSGPWQLGVHC